jgi:hypothetical protein
VESGRTYSAAKVWLCMRRRSTSATASVSGILGGAVRDLEHTVVDDKGLVAAGHHVAGLPVGAVSDL